LSMNNFIHLSTKLRILVKHGPYHVIKLRFHTLHELSNLSLEGAALMGVTWLISNVWLI
jgi:hypothetical protein